MLARPRGEVRVRFLIAHPLDAHLHLRRAPTVDRTIASGSAQAVAARASRRENSATGSSDITRSSRHVVHFDERPPQPVADAHGQSRAHGRSVHSAMHARTTRLGNSSGAIGGAPLRSFPNQLAAGWRATANACRPNPSTPTNAWTASTPAHMARYDRVTRMRNGTVSAP